MMFPNNKNSRNFYHTFVKASKILKNLYNLQHLGISLLKQYRIANIVMKTCPIKVLISWYENCMIKYDLQTCEDALGPG
jgi:hypothetical protein